MLYNAAMRTEARQNIRIWVKTHRLLRIFAAHTGESMIAALHRITLTEYERVLGTRRDASEGK